MKIEISFFLRFNYSIIDCEKEKTTNDRIGD